MFTTMTKKHNHLWEKIIAIDNLELAMHKASLSNGRSSESKRKAVEAAKLEPQKYIDLLRNYMMDENRDYGCYAIYPVFDPKLRLIYATPFFPYRVAHHAVLNVVAPIWDGMMQYQSFACRKGYGQHRAGEMCARYTKRFKYVAHFDISQFYPSVDHEILKTVLRRKISDKTLLTYFDGLIDSISIRHKNLRIAKTLDHPDAIRMIGKIEQYIEKCDNRMAGVPTGNYPSQWFGNIYMNEADEFLIRNGMSTFCRYCDDIICFSNDKSFLDGLKKRFVDFLWEKLMLMVSKAEVYPTSRKVSFCGYVYSRDGVILLKKRSAKRYANSTIEINNAYSGDIIGVETALSRLASMDGLLKKAHTYNFRESNGFNDLYQTVKTDFRIWRENERLSQES